MNAQVQEFLETKTTESEKQKQLLREKHLIELGLTQDNRVWINGYETGCKYDEKSGKYYRGKINAIEVTDEEYAEICKICPEEKASVNNTFDVGAERTLNTISKIYLIIGILISLVLVICGFASFDDYNGEELGWLYMGGAVVCLLSTLVVWALLRCVSNISISLKEIKANNVAM